MSINRVEEILSILSENPSQSVDAINEEVAKRRRMHRHERGITSEVIAQFLVKEIPQVTEIRKINSKVNGLDCDFIAEFINTDPVNVQVKNSDRKVSDFLEKMRKAQQTESQKTRWVVLCTRYSFDKIKSDFISQVNALDGRKSLTS